MSSFVILQFAAPFAVVDRIGAQLGRLLGTVSGAVEGNLQLDVCQNVKCVFFLKISDEQ